MVQIGTKNGVFENALAMNAGAADLRVSTTVSKGILIPLANDIASEMRSCALLPSCRLFTPKYPNNGHECA